MAIARTTPAAAASRPRPARSPAAHGAAPPAPAAGRPATVDEYIAGFTPGVAAILEAVRRTVRQAAPEAQETISYRMPAFVQSGVLVYFAAFKRHVGLYPPVVGDAALEADAARYAGEKGNLRFPLDEPMPHALIGRIVRHRLRQNLARAAARPARRRGGTP